MAQGHFGRSSEMKRGAYIGLILHSPTFSVDVALQVLDWRGEALIARFYLTSPSTPYALLANNVFLDIIVGDAPIGRIECCISVSPTLRAVKRKIDLGKTPYLSRVFDKDIGEIHIDGQGQFAFRFRKAFISYSDLDKHEQAMFATGLAEARIEILTDDDRFVLGEVWYEQAQKLIDQSDVFYLLWSQNSSTSRPVAREIEMALEAKQAYQKLRIVPILVGDEFIDLPPSLKDTTAIGKWQKYGYSSKFLRQQRKRRCAAAC
jgi:TIR domain